MIRCLIVDDHPLTRDGTRFALRRAFEDIDVVEVSSLREALDVLRDRAPVDLVLLDLDLPDSRGIDTLRHFHSWRVDAGADGTRALVLSAHHDAALARTAIENFRTGFMVKASSPAIFVQAVALTLAGGIFIPEHALQGGAATPQNSPMPELTVRERAVAALLVQGFTYKRIAKELERRDGKPVSEHTVRAHVGNIAWKLGVTENVKSGVMAEIARRGLSFESPR